MIEHDVLNLLDNLEQEVSDLCPQSEVLFSFLFEMKKQLAIPFDAKQAEPLLKLLDQFEELLDTEVFWS